MKYKLTNIIVFAAVGLLSACSKPTVTERAEELKDTKGEWTHEQTDRAIDTYLEGLKEEEKLLDRNVELRKRLQFFDENRCSRDVLMQRRAEIDSARARSQSKRESIRNLSR